MLASLKIEEWHHQARREVLVNYLGFPFWDVLTFPLMSRETGEFNQILIDRIEGNATARQQIVMQPKLIVRASSGGPVGITRRHRD